MHLADPATWQCPLGWHPDCDGPWELDRLRELALAFLKPCREHWVRLDIAETGCVRAEFFRGLQRLGIASANRHADGRSEARFRLCLGAADHEQTAASIPQAVQMIVGTKATRKVEA
jgi:hypothetical protein